MWGEFVQALELFSIFGYNMLINLFTKNWTLALLACRWMCSLRQENMNQSSVNGVCVNIGREKQIHKVPAKLRYIFHCTPYEKRDSAWSRVN